MPLDIQAFRAAANLGGSINLQNAGGGAQLVRGSIGTWFKSLLNIGNARQQNAQVLNELRHAIQNDPRYARVDAQANALLGKLGTTLPLSSRNITKILDRLDTDSVSSNRAFAERLGVRSSNRQVLDLKLYMSCQDIGFQSNQIPANVRNQLSRFFGEQIVAMAGNYTVPLQENAVADLVEDKANDLSVMCKNIAESGLSDNDKRILQGLIFDGGTMQTPAQMAHFIEIRQNRSANEALQRQMRDVSNPQTPLRAHLAAVLEQAGIVEVPAQCTLEGLGQAVKKEMQRMAHDDTTLLNAGQGQQAVARVVANFVESYQAAAELPNPQDAAYMKQAVLTSSSPMPVAYVRELAAHAGDIDPNSLLRLGDMQNPKDMLVQLNGFNDILAAGFTNLPDKLKLEGNLGHQNFTTHVTGLALNRAGLNQGQSQNLYQSLLGPAATSLRQGLGFQSQYSPEAAGRLTVFTAIHGNMAEQAGVPTERFLEDTQVPLIHDKAALPLDARAMLAGFQAVELKNVELARHPAGTEAQIKAAVLNDLATDWQHKFLDEMHKHLRNEQGIVTEPTFAKDLVRGQSISLNGRPVPTSLEQLPLPVQQHIQEHFPQEGEPRTSAIKDAIVTEGYNRIAQFLFGDEALFANLNPVQKNEVFGMAGLCSQRTIVPVTESADKLLTPVPINIITRGDKPGQKGIALSRTPAGDITLRISTKDFPGIIATGQGNTMLNPDASVRENVVTSILPRAELTRMAQRDWAPMVGMDNTTFRDSVFRNKQLPAEQLFQFGQMDVSFHVSLERAAE